MSDECKIRQEGDHVYINFKGAESLVPWDAALALSQGIAAAAKQAEAFAKQNRMIGDAVLLEKAGLPTDLMRGVPLRQLLKRGNNV